MVFVEGGLIDYYLGEIFNIYSVSLSDDHQSFNEVPKLSDIAGPIVMIQSIIDIRRQNLVLFVFFIIFLQKELAEVKNVLPSLP